MEIQIALEEERIKYQYEKMMQEVREQCDRKVEEAMKQVKEMRDREREREKDRLAESTRCSNSVRLTNLSREEGKYPDINTSMSREGEDVQLSVSESSGTKRNKLVRSNKREVNFSSGGKMEQEKDKNRYIAGNFSKAAPAYDKIVHQILKQDRK